MKIGVMGCGWLGFPLAMTLLRDDYEVLGTTTTTKKVDQLKQAGITPFIIKLEENGIVGDIHDFLEKLDILIINVPPGLRGKKQESYVKKMRQLHIVIKTSKLKKLIFASSTAVYGEIDGMVTEDTLPQPQTESGKQLLIAENIFRMDTGLLTTIIRFGGLIGLKRHPVNMLFQRKTLLNGNLPINLIHLDDCIGIIKAVINESWWNELYNAVYPYHPSKKSYYTYEAQKRGLPIPEYIEKGKKVGKVVSSKKLIAMKKFDFKTSIRTS